MESNDNQNGQNISTLIGLGLLAGSGGLAYYSLVPWQAFLGIVIVALFLVLPNRMKLTGDSITNWIVQIRFGTPPDQEIEEETDAE